MGLHIYKPFSLLKFKLYKRRVLSTLFTVKSLAFRRVPEISVGLVNVFYIKERVRTIKKGWFGEQWSGERPWVS